jgi:activator of HSP90 ATPase
MKNYKKYLVPLPAPPEEVYLGINERRKASNCGLVQKLFLQKKLVQNFLFGRVILLGKNLEFEPNKKIVQQWYFGDQEEPSIVTIKLHEDKKGTSLEFVQTNIPDKDFADFTAGIEEYFLGGLADFFEIEY